MSARVEQVRYKAPALSVEMRRIVRKHKAGIRRLTVEWPDPADLEDTDLEQVLCLRQALGLCSYCGTHPARQFCRWDPNRRDENALPLAPKTPAQVRRAASKARYAASLKGRAAAAKYAASEKGRARSARYNRSEGGRRRAIKHNSTAKGRARTKRFEETAHRREYKSLSYIYGSPYKDLDVTAVLSVNRALPSWGARLKGLRFKKISVRCTCWKCRGRKKAMSTRLIPIHHAMAGNGYRLPEREADSR